MSNFETVFAPGSPKKWEFRTFASFAIAVGKIEFVYYESIKREPKIRETDEKRVKKKENEIEGP